MSARPDLKAATVSVWRGAAATAGLVGTLVTLGWVATAGAQSGASSDARSTSVTTPAPAGSARAVFAGGCFWCVESDFDKVPGVLSTTSGYTGGTVANPTYQQVSADKTGHAEVVEVVYDPARVSYEQLVEYFWRTIDPTVKNRQFCDVGSPYRSGIFAQDEAQLAIAKASRDALQKSKPFEAPIVTEVVRGGVFYPAESYHQDYYKKNPLRYRYYRTSCGRDARLKQLWGEQAAQLKDQ